MKTKTDYWKKIWTKKGLSQTNNLRELDGYERVSIDEKIIVKGIVNRLNIKGNDKVLEVGCGAGLLAQHLNCDYVGVDYSLTLVKKHIKLLNDSVLIAEANNLPFKDNYFDKVFSYGVFFYFPDKEYAMQAVREMKRVCKNKGKVYIGDLPFKSHRNTHLLFKKTDFKGRIFKGFWINDRFDVLLDREQ